MLYLQRYFTNAVFEIVDETPTISIHKTLSCSYVTILHELAGIGCWDYQVPSSIPALGLLFRLSKFSFPSIVCWELTCDGLVSRPGKVGLSSV